MARQAREVVEYRLYELPADFPILLLDGEKWHISDTISARLHFHNCLEIGICHTQSGTLLINDTPNHFARGDVTLIQRHIPHTTYSDKGMQSLWSYIFVDLDMLVADLIGSSAHVKALNDCKLLLRQADYPKVHFLASCILDELRGHKPGYQNAVKGLFVAFYYEVTRIREDMPQPREPEALVKKTGTPVLTPALNYIFESYMEKTTVDELAKMCHLSTTHFRRLFLNIMGTSPLAFINATRIDHACMLLKTGEKPILEIAAEVGFASLSSFNRAFIAAMKVSPRAYRNAGDATDRKPDHKYVLNYRGWTEPDL